MGPVVSHSLSVGDKLIINRVAEVVYQADPGQDTVSTPRTDTNHLTVHTDN